MVQEMGAISLPLLGAFPSSPWRVGCLQAAQRLINQTEPRYPKATSR
jgi:hypothetical protein